MAHDPGNHHQDHQPQKSALDSIMQYARTQGIQMHASIAPYHFPRHGLGIHAAGLVEVCRIKSLSLYALYSLARLDSNLFNYDLLAVDAKQSSPSGQHEPDACPTIFFPDSIVYP
jgi:hypothetical protein